MIDWHEVERQDGPGYSYWAEYGAAPYRLHVSKMASSMGKILHDWKYYICDPTGKIVASGDGFFSEQRAKDRCADAAEKVSTIFKVGKR